MRSSAPTDSSWSCSHRRESSSTQVFICPHFKHEDCACRKPRVGMVRDYLDAHPMDAARSFMVGDRDTDMEFAANLGITGLKIRLDGDRSADLAGHRARAFSDPARRAQVRRKTKETEVEVEVDLVARGAERASPPAWGFSITCSSRSRSTAASRSSSHARAICTSTSIIRSRIAPWPSAPRCARRWATSTASRATVSCSRWTRPRRRWRSISRAGRIFVWEGRFNRERVGELPTELVPHFFRSLAEALGAALHINGAGREQPSHDRILLQGRRAQPAPGDSPRGHRTAEHQGRPVSAREVVDGRERRRQHRLAAVRARASRRRRASCPRTRRASAPRATSFCPASARPPTPWRGCERRGLDACMPRRSPSRCSASVSGCSCCTRPPRKAARAASASFRAWRAIRRGTRPARAAHGLEHARDRRALPAARGVGRRRIRLFRAQLRARRRAPPPWRADATARAFSACVAVAQFLRRAISPRALGRRRRAPAAEFPEAPMTSLRLDCPMHLIPAIDLEGRPLRAAAARRFRARDALRRRTPRLCSRNIAASAPTGCTSSISTARATAALANRAIIASSPRSRAVKLQVGGGLRDTRARSHRCSSSASRAWWSAAPPLRMSEQVRGWLEHFGAGARDARPSTCAWMRPACRASPPTAGSGSRALSLWSAVDEFRRRRTRARAVHRRGPRRRAVAVRTSICTARPRGASRSIAWQASGGIRNARDLQALPRPAACPRR